MIRPANKITFTKIPGWLCVCALLVLCLAKGSLAAQEQDTHSSRLLHAGLDLFPSFLAADRNITEKKDSDGNLVLYIVHHNDRRTAQKVANRLSHIKNIKGTPLKVVIVRDDYEEFHKQQPAGIFIAQPHLPHLTSVVNYGKEKSIITFSPFVGDVTQGVTGSIAVTARILPQVNMTTIADSKLDFKPFFLRIASRYPEVETH